MPSKAPVKATYYVQTEYFPLDFLAIAERTGACTTVPVEWHREFQEPQDAVDYARQFVADCTLGYGHAHVRRYYRPGSRKNGWMLKVWKTPSGEIKEQKAQRCPTN